MSEQDTLVAARLEEQYSIRTVKDMAQVAREKGMLPSEFLQAETEAVAAGGLRAVLDADLEAEIARRAA